MATRRCYTPTYRSVPGLLLVWGGWWVLRPLFADVPWLQHPATPPLAALAMVAGGWLLAQTLWRWSARDRRLFDGVYVLLGACLLAGSLVVARDAQAAHDRRTADQVATVRAAMRQLAAQRAAEALRAWQDRQARAAEDRFVQYEDRMPAADLTALRALDQQMTAELQARAAAWRAATATITLSSPESWIRFQNLNQWEDTRLNYQLAWEQSQAFLLYLDSVRARYESALADLQLQPPADRVGIAEMERWLQTLEQSHALTIRGPWPVYRDSRLVARQSAAVAVQASPAVCSVPRPSVRGAVANQVRSARSRTAGHR
jgi:hypothetical protein